LDEYQNDNFVLKSENNRLNSELSTYKIKNKENESLFNQISELKTQKFNLEKKVQDILTLETTSTKTSDIREKIEIRQQESNIQNLNNIIIDKTTRIGELEDKYNKILDENNKLKMDLTTNSVR
jgi:predicted RNase H-like nuclease (RuvC/YqgF family)